MNKATNKLNKTISFPTIGISFKANETKLLSDDIAIILRNNSFIKIESDTQENNTKGRKKIIKDNN